MQIPSIQRDFRNFHVMSTCFLHSKSAILTTGKQKLNHLVIFITRSLVYYLAYRISVIFITRSLVYYLAYRISDKQYEGLDSNRMRCHGHSLWFWGRRNKHKWTITSSWNCLWNHNHWLKLRDYEVISKDVPAGLVLLVRRTRVSNLMSNINYPFIAVLNLAGNQNRTINITLRVLLEMVLQHTL